MQVTQELVLWILLHLLISTDSTDSELSQCMLNLYKIRLKNIVGAFNNPTTCVVYFFFSLDFFPLLKIEDSF